MYLTALRITFRHENRIQVVNINPENLEAFKQVHGEYQFISVRPVYWIF
jgi:hypothetical protein